MKLRKIKSDGHTVYMFHCPGCKYGHHFAVEGPMTWDFNGDMEKPTFNPSLLVNDSHPEMRCHLVMKEGKIHFCSDSFHELKGKVVDIPDLDDMGDPK